MSGSEIALPSTVGLFTPRAYDDARVSGITSMEPNPDAIARIGEITAEASPAFAFPVAATGLVIVLRGGHRDYLPHRWDGRFNEAGTTQNYIGLGGLAEDDPSQVPAVTKAEVMRWGRPILELTVHDFSQALGPAMATTVVGGFQHPNQRWAAFGTLTDFGHSLTTNVKRIRAVKRVAEEGLEPFIIRRRGDKSGTDVEPA